ncbi:predicted protein [Sclerotinia sclerotiorum 1980 UF-70]|uniref:Uncharacterized protein n=1 Tax=Sclerotinia sclerotiorum (strain ATCC 18683 / 1980 / Ss-1) TaxID=665079 RepID=A7EA04_SCLS1|nr:predicted protein [Sclerotinia sclerotiorum 1980 UF-70]EDN99282.1 predicted protein [Sclerotinia sclerotiorum 1980 UF-70]
MAFVGVHAMNAPPFGPLSFADGKVNNKQKPPQLVHKREI